MQYDFVIPAVEGNRWFHHLARWIEKRGGCRVIPRGENGKQVLYLKRYYIVKTPWFEIFLHQFFRGDIGDIHDHPFFSFGRILQGGYWEYLTKYIVGYRGMMYPNETYRIWRKPGMFRWAWRPASNAAHDNPRGYHKVILRNEDLNTGNVWTLFCTGPRVKHSDPSRAWGFLSGGRFVPFQQMRNDEGVPMQASHTEFKGWIFPWRIKT